MLNQRLVATLIELVNLPSTSGHEEHVRDYLRRRLETLGLATQPDTAGNLICLLPGSGAPLLLNAHMDRVPPGLGHQPVLRDGMLYSDGSTNLGADDAAGLAIIVEVLQRLIEQHLPHPPIIAVFTVQEETGICGATTFDALPYHVERGIVFDNAFEAGVVVAQGAAYESFDVLLTGRTGHPGKDLSQTIDAIELFRYANYPYGSLHNDRTRILIGRINGGSARNAVPAYLSLEGELRSFEPLEVRQRHMQNIRSAFEQVARRFGGQAQATFSTHSSGYSISEDEPLLQSYCAVLEQRGARLELRPTFIGSDTSGFRPHVKAITISTGVVNEHSIDEYVPLAPLGQLVEDTLQLLREIAIR